MGDRSVSARSGWRTLLGTTRDRYLLLAALALAPGCGREREQSLPSAEPTSRSSVEQEPAAEAALSRNAPAQKATAGTCTTPDTCYESARAGLHGGDTIKARRFFERACAGEHGPACFQLGLMYRDGKGVSPDDTQARQWFEQACRAGSNSGCDALGH